jgi:uncharacterized Zn-binding protein involved in type VI secretion
MSDHGGKIITGDATMKIDGLPVARLGDLHSCPLVYPVLVIPHAVTPIIMGVYIENRPLINGVPAAFEGDMTMCGAKLLSCNSKAKGIAIGVAVGAALLLLPFLFSHKNKSTSTPSSDNKSTTVKQSEAITKQIEGFTDFINRNLTDNPKQSVPESKPDSCDCPPK